MQLVAFSVKKNSCSNEKRQIPREKDEFRGSNSAAQTQVARLEIPRSAENCGPNNYTWNKRLLALLGHATGHLCQTFSNIYVAPFVH